MSDVNATPNLTNGPAVKAPIFTLEDVRAAFVAGENWARWTDGNDGPSEPNVDEYVSGVAAGTRSSSDGFVTARKPTDAEMAAAEHEALVRSFDGAPGVEPTFSRFFERKIVPVRLHTPDPETRNR